MILSRKNSLFTRQVFERKLQGWLHDSPRFEVLVWQLMCPAESIGEMYAVFGCQREPTAYAGLDLYKKGMGFCVCVDDLAKHA